MHGDEIWYYMKVFWRPWKPEIVRRQLCLDCGKALDRNAICTIIGRDIHELNEVE